MPDPSVLEVTRHQFSFEDPWRIPPQVRPARLRRSVDGAATRLPTTAAAYYDDSNLYVIFRGHDDFIRARYRERDEPLYEEDVLEVFLAPAEPRVYYELEVSPIGTLFDARIESPHGDRKTMRADHGWDCRGLWTALWRDHGDHGSSTFATVLAIPFAALGRQTPAPGESWRANFFRIDRGRDADEFSAWQPTLKNPADFHVPAAFGELRFK